ncbi:alpha/beta hydrolase [Streptomyces sp. NPDC004291]
MSYQWSLDPQDLFRERYPQMINTSMPAEDVDTVRATISDMWQNEPGGWVFEWSQLAERYARAGRHQLAMLAYGWAKFPALADGAKRMALVKQAEQYELAAPGFDVDFRRKILEVPYQGGTTPVPVHLLAAPDLPASAPVLLASGGVDTWKMDLHDAFAAFALQARVRVLAFDIAGTGESSVSMTADGGAEIVRGLIGHARTLGNGTVAHLGISMGGHYSARTGLASEADAAIVFGGPVERTFAPGRLSAYGMADIVANALGFDSPPTDAERNGQLESFSLRPLLDRDDNTPMLVVNGADDVHVSQHDTLVFKGRRDTEVHLIPGTGHCATTKLPEAAHIMISWLKKTLTT